MIVSSRIDGCARDLVPTLARYASIRIVVDRPGLAASQSPAWIVQYIQKLIGSFWSVHSREVNAVILTRFGYLDFWHAGESASRSLRILPAAFFPAIVQPIIWNRQLSACAVEDVLINGMLHHMASHAAPGGAMSEASVASWPWAERSSEAILRGRSGARCSPMHDDYLLADPIITQNREARRCQNWMRLPNLTELAPERSADGPHEPAVGEWFSSIPQVSGRASGPEAGPVGECSLLTACSSVVSVSYSFLLFSGSKVRRRRLIYVFDGCYVSIVGRR